MSQPLPEGTAPTPVALTPEVTAITQGDGTWGLSNAGLVCAGSEVVLIDTFFTERRNRLLRELVMSIAPRAPRILISTHHHGDHVNGNGMFPEAVIVGHEVTRTAVERLDVSVSARRFPGVDFGETTPVPPAITFSRSLCVHAGDLTLEVFFPGAAHCPGNTAVFIRESRILFAGDLLLKDCTPTFGAGSANGFLEVLDELEQLQPERIVPGHGPVCGPEIIERTREYVRLIMALAESGVADGCTPLEVADRADLGEFKAWQDSERVVMNVYAAYREHPGAPADLPLDVASMWRDTETYLGRSLRSLA